MLKTLAMLNNKSCVVTSIKSNPLQSDRVELLKSFPASTKKTAVVLVDVPNAPFKGWVQKKIRSNHEGPGVLCLMASSTTGSLEGA